MMRNRSAHFDAWCANYVTDVLLARKHGLDVKTMLSSRRHGLKDHKLDVGQPCCAGQSWDVVLLEIVKGAVAMLSSRMAAVFVAQKGITRNLASKKTCFS